MRAVIFALTTDTNEESLRRKLTVEGVLRVDFRSFNEAGAADSAASKETTETKTQQPAAREIGKPNLSEVAAKTNDKAVAENREPTNPLPRKRMDRASRRKLFASTSSDSISS